MTSSAQSTNKICKDVNKEFCSHFLSLFASCYEEPTTTPISSFPAAPPIQSQTEKQKKLQTGMPQNFNSRICDLRLMKQVDEIESAKKQTHQKLTEIINNKSGVIQTLENDDSINLQEITDMFIPDKAPRPEIPKYIQEIQSDQRKEQEIRNAHKSNLFDPVKSEKQFKANLEKQNQRTMERKKKIYDKQRENVKTHHDFLKTLPKTTNYEEKYATSAISPKTQPNQEQLQETH